jgi:integrase
MVRRRENGEGSIRYDRERKRWEARVTVEMRGRDAVRKKITAKTKPELLARLKDATRAVDDGLPVTDRRATLAQFLGEWLDHLAHTDRSAETVTNYRDVVRAYIVPKVGRVKLAKLTPAHVERMQRDILADGKSARTARLSRSVLRAALRHAERHGLVQRNVAALAEPVAQAHHEKQSMTAAQVKKLMASMRGKRDEAAIVLLCTAGLRRAEVLGLKWSDIDVKEGTVRVTRAVKRTPQGLEASDVKTARSKRTLHVPPVAVAALKRHRARQGADRLAAGEHWVDADWVVTTSWGTPLDPDTLGHRFIDACETAKIGRWTPHDARHTVGSLMFNAGADLRDVSEFLGHSSIRVTSDIYVHTLPERRGAAAAALVRALA